MELRVVMVVVSCDIAVLSGELGDQGNDDEYGV